MIFCYQYDNITIMKILTEHDCCGELFSSTFEDMINTKGALFMKKKQKGVMIALTVVTLIGVLAALYFLPSEIPLHFGVGGTGNVASKYFLLLFVPVPAILYWAVCRKYKK